MTTFREMLGPRLVRRVVHRARKLGLSRQDLCETAEISDTHLCNLLAGRKRLTWEMGDRLMRAVDLSMAEHYEGKDRPMYRGSYLPAQFEKKAKRALSYAKRAQRKLEAGPGPVFERLV